MLRYSVSTEAEKPFQLILETINLVYITYLNLKSDIIPEDSGMGYHEKKITYI